VEVGDLDGFSEGPAMLSVRPEDIVLNHHAGGVEAKIEEIVYLGNVVYYTLSGGGVDLRVQAVPGETFEAGERIRFRIRRATAINGR
jgi:ABC-type sugar transport system ATPase subunit